MSFSHRVFRSRALLIVHSPAHSSTLHSTSRNIRCKSDVYSPTASSKQRTWSEEKAAWIADVRRQITKGRKNIDWFEHTIAKLEKKQEKEEHEFRQIMEAFTRYEPKPEDYGLSRHWRPEHGPDHFGMGKWPGWHRRDRCGHTKGILLRPSLALKCPAAYKPLRAAHNDVSDPEEAEGSSTWFLIGPPIVDSAESSPRCRRLAWTAAKA